MEVEGVMLSSHPSMDTRSESSLELDDSKNSNRSSLDSLGLGSPIPASFPLQHQQMKSAPSEDDTKSMSHEMQRVGSATVDDETLQLEETAVHLIESLINEAKDARTEIQKEKEAVQQVQQCVEESRNVSFDLRPKVAPIDDGLPSTSLSPTQEQPSIELEKTPARGLLHILEPSGIGNLSVERTLSPIAFNNDESYDATESLKGESAIEQPLRLDRLSGAGLQETVDDLTYSRSVDRPSTASIFDVSTPHRVPSLESAEESRPPRPNSSSLSEKSTQNELADEKNELADDAEVDDEGTSTEDNPTSPFGFDLAAAKRRIDASSLMFIERLRGAAHKRKQKVAKSRDSLVAKEKEFRDMEALINREAANKQEKLEEDEQNPDSPSDQRPPTPQDATVTDFKARRMPVSFGSGHRGIPRVKKRPTTTPMSPPLAYRHNGKKHENNQELHDNLTRYGSGQLGVPKVVKRPTTTPVSPLLGLRRTKNDSDKTEGGGRDSSKMLSDRTNVPFKARPIPQPMRATGGIVGVPKVTKRPMTVAKSPQLGLKRGSAAKETLLQEPKLVIDRTSIDNNNSPKLLGLQLLTDDNFGQSQERENMTPSHTPVHQRAMEGYCPHSTVRAKKRAEYDKERSRREAKRKDFMKEQRRQTIIQKRTEVEKLREGLR